MAEENPFYVLLKAYASTYNSVDAVRLAALQPGSGNDTLKVSLRNWRPNETPRYECISYDRTSQSSDVDIEVDGSSYSIPASLEEALRSLRLLDEERYLWADVLVGNSAEERSTQASTIEFILEHANRTIVWLGLSDDTSVAVFDILRTLASRWNQSAQHAGIPPNWARARPDQMLTQREKMLSFPPAALQTENVAAWKEIERLFDSGPFKSVQIIPELVLSKEAVVMLGDKVVGWKDFVNTSRVYPLILAAVKGEFPSQAFMQAFQLLNSHETAVWRYRNDDGLELLPMIQSAKDCETNDLREFVFSMLPITRPSRRAVDPRPVKPKADYSKTVQEVFKEAAKYIVLDRQDLLLWWCERPPCGNQIERLPSWVPDWSAPNPKKGVFISPKNKLREWSDSIPSRKPIRVDDDFTLHVQAHALDRIESVSAIFTAENCRRLAYNEWQNLPSTPGETQQAKMDRFWRTLVMDQDGMGETREKRAKPPAQMFQSWWSMLAEERILILMNCTLEELGRDEELRERARNNQDVRTLWPLTQQSGPFVELLKKNAIGRRFFTTASGRTGMTAVEQCDDNDPAHANEAPTVPNFDNVMSSSLAHNFISAFQPHLQQTNPRMAEVFAQAIRGEMPGQSPPGVRGNDLVVACVEGFQPYVLSPESAGAVAQQLAGNLVTDEKYKYVGSCYLHGVMEGEPFLSRDWLGRETFKTDVKLVDIGIV